MNKLVDEVVSTVQRDLPFSISETVRGGSTGKGTAIKGAADVDIVLFINNLPKLSTPNSELWRRPLLHMVLLGETYTQ